MKLHHLLFKILFLVLMTQIFKIWSEKAPLPLHLVCSFRTFGQIAGVFIALPFLSEVNTQHNSTFIKTINISSTMPVKIQDSNNRIHWPFAIVGILIILTGILSLAISIGKCAEVESLRQLDTETSPSKCCLPCIQNRNIYFWLLVSSLFLVQMAIAAKDVSIIFGILPVATESKLHMSKREATLVIFLLLITRSVGRAVLGLITRIMSLKIYSIICILLALGLMIVLSTWGVNSSTVFWITVPSHSVFSSAGTPAAYSLCDRYIRLTGSLVALTEIGKSLGSLEALLLNGYILDHFGGKGVLMECLGWSTLIVFGFISIICIGYKIGDRFEEIEVTEELKPLVEEKETNLSE